MEEALAQRGARPERSISPNKRSRLPSWLARLRGGAVVWWYGVKNTLPLHSRFRTIIIPAAVLIIASLSFPVGSLSTTVAGGLAVLFFTLWVQAKCHSMMYLGSINGLLVAMQTRSAITQKFISRVLASFAAQADYPAHAAKLIGSPPTPSNLKEVAERLEDASGVALDGTLYAILLSEAAEFHPRRLYATWDTKEFEPDLDKFGWYLDMLKAPYDSISPQNKARVFIFDDQSKYRAEESTPRWQALLQRHWELGFRELYWCPRSRFEQLRKGRMDERIEDFVYFCTPIAPFIAHAYIIGRDVVDGSSDGHNNTYVRGNSDDVQRVLGFFETLRAACQDEGRVIRPPSHTGKDTAMGQLILKYRSSNPGERAVERTVELTEAEKSELDGMQLSEIVADGKHFRRLQSSESTEDSTGGQTGISN